MPKSQAPQLKSFSGTAWLGGESRGRPSTNSWVNGAIPLGGSSHLDAPPGNGNRTETCQLDWGLPNRGKCRQCHSQCTFSSIQPKMMWVNNGKQPLAKQLSLALSQLLLVIVKNHMCYVRDAFFLSRRLVSHGFLGVRSSAWPRRC